MSLGLLQFRPTTFEVHQLWYNLAFSITSITNNRIASRMSQGTKIPIEINPSDTLFGYTHFVMKWRWIFLRAEAYTFDWVFLSVQIIIYFNVLWKCVKGITCNIIAFVDDIGGERNWPLPWLGQCSKLPIKFIVYFRNRERGEMIHSGILDGRPFCLEGW